MRATSSTVSARSWGQVESVTTTGCEPFPSVRSAMISYLCPKLNVQVADARRPEIRGTQRRSLVRIDAGESGERGSTTLGCARSFPGSGQPCPATLAVLVRVPARAYEHLRLHS